MAGVREFNRFYTRIIGLLDRHFLNSPYSLTEARVLYELAHGRNRTAKAIRSATGIDAGYLSRIVESFIAAGLVGKTRDRDDARYQVLELTRAGKAAFSRLEEAQRGSVEAVVSRLSSESRLELVDHMVRIRGLLSDIE